VDSNASSFLTVSPFMATLPRLGVEDQSDRTSKEGLPLVTRAIRPAVILLALATVGCSMTTPFGPVGMAVPPAASGPSYQGGRGSRLFPSSEHFLVQTRDALDDVGIHSIAERHEDGATILEGKTVNNRRANVAIRVQGAETRVTARFGTLGDEPLSRAFLDRMTARLGSVKAAAKAGSASDSPIILSPRPKPNRASQQPGTIVDRQLSGGYRDSLSP